MVIKFQMWATVFIQHVEENPYLTAVKQMFPLMLIC